jgi:hypothetical protein
MKLELEEGTVVPYVCLALVTECEFTRLILEVDGQNVAGFNTTPLPFSFFI